MTAAKQNAEMDALLAGFSGRYSLLCVDLDTGEELLSADPGAGCPAGTVISLPLLVCALEQVRKGRLTLGRELLKGEALDGVLARMIAGEAPALETVAGLVGEALADEYFQGTLGLRDTACTDTPRTSNQSLCYLLGKLHRGEILTEALRARALKLLRPDCAPDGLPRPAAYLAGRGDTLFHTAGIYPASGRALYVGAFLWDAPSQALAAAKAGALTRLLYASHCL